MFTQIFDTHSHYTDSAFDADRHEVLSALPEAGIVHAVLAGTTLEDSTAGIALADRYDYIYAAVGIHPETAGQQPADYLAQLEQLAKHPKVVAIGEIGLDYHYEGYDRESQSVLLREQLDLAKQLDLPVIIHARDCTEDYLRILPHTPEHLPPPLPPAGSVCRLLRSVLLTPCRSAPAHRRQAHRLAAVPADR